MRRLTIVAHALMLVLVLRMIGVMLLQRSVILFFFLGQFEECEIV